MAVQPAHHEEERVLKACIIFFERGQENEAYRYMSEMQFSKDRADPG